MQVNPLLSLPSSVIRNQYAINSISTEESMTNVHNVSTHVAPAATQDECLLTMVYTTILIQH